MNEAAQIFARIFQSISGYFKTLLHFATTFATRNFWGRKNNKDSLPG